ncbi:hypothetical protein KUF59_31230 [Bradyrhizobium arachidis]|nr:hypothetical protein KUF59_31230 [Bradyrhizobium arachidis]
MPSIIIGIMIVPLGPTPRSALPFASGRRRVAAPLAEMQRQLPQFVAAFGKDVEGAELHLVIMLARVRRIEIRDAIDAEQYCFVIEHKVLWRALRGGLDDNCDGSSYRNFSNHTTVSVVDVYQFLGSGDVNGNHRALAQTM